MHNSESHTLNTRQFNVFTHRQTDGTHDLLFTPISENFVNINVKNVKSEISYQAFFQQRWNRSKGISHIQTPSARKKEGMDFKYIINTL